MRLRRLIAAGCGALLLPVLAGALGPLVQQLQLMLQGGSSSPILAVIYGLGGVGLREIVNQLGKTTGVTAP